MGAVRRALVVLIAAFALAACRVDTTVHVAVEPDGSGTITLTAVADAELVAQTPGLADDLRFDDITAAGWVVDGPTPTADGGLQVVVTHPFATVQEATALLLSLNGPDGPLHDVVVGRTVTDDAITTTLTGTVRVANGLDAFADPDVLAAIGGSPYANDLAAANLRPSDVVTFTFSADLPGKVSAPATAGTVDNPVGTTVDTTVATTAANNTASAASPSNTAAGGDAPLSWSVPLDGTTADLTTTAVLAQGSGGGVWGTVATVSLIALVAWVVLALAFIAFVANARRVRARRRAV
jgi:hypothetical protein